MRRYRSTHPWISFRIELARSASPELWVALGEAASKCEHLSRVPLQLETSRALHRLYLAKGVAATTAIEGNSLTEQEVGLALDGKLKLPPSKRYLQQEVENITAICNDLGARVDRGESLRITPQLVIDFNQRVLEKLPNDDAQPGRFRDHSVVVGNVYRGAPAEDCEYLLARLCEWLDGPEFQPPDSAAAIHSTVYAIVRAILAHVYFVWIHPFGDGNGRTARLIEFAILLSAGVPSPAVHLMSNHYNQTRSEYYRQLDRASRSGGDLLPFLSYAVSGFVDGLREQLDIVLRQQWDLAWRDYVHLQFHGRQSAVDRRQELLAIEVGFQEQAIDIRKLIDGSTRLARAYRQRTDRTAMRDVASLVARGLLEQQGRMVRARKEAILAFLPRQSQPERS